MSIVKLTYKQEELITKAALNCGFKDFDITTHIGCLKGDNFLGVINAVTIREKGNRKVLHLILKSALTNELFRNWAHMAAMYKREVCLYDTIIPRLLKYQDEKAISQPFSGVAKYYGSVLEEKNESILMQNLKEYGYQLWDRMKPMNEEHIILVFIEYARFHSVSLAFKQQHAEEFKELTKPIQLDIVHSTEATEVEKMDKIVNAKFKTALTAVQGNPKATAALKRLQSNTGQLFEQKRTEKSKAPVVLHADCWCNNMLFKYKEDQTTPAKVCFIDWQLSKMGSPVQDLVYFFMVCGSKETYPNLVRYLTIYHKALSQNLQEFGCDPEKIFSFEALLDEWKKHAWYGLMIAIMIMRMMLSNLDEIPNISEDSTDEKSLIKSLLDYEIANSSEYKTRLCNLVEFMSDNKYI